MSTPHISNLREHLMATLASLRDRENPMEPDRARAVAQVASVLVDTARVEVDYLRATGQDRSAFLEQPADPSVAQLGNAPGAGVVKDSLTTASGYTQGTVERKGNVTIHRLAG